MDDKERERESREALERVGRESETIGGSAVSQLGRRVAGHFAAEDARGEGPEGVTDPVELWGRRIGRALSLVGVVILALWLLVQLRLL